MRKTTTWTGMQEKVCYTISSLIKMYSVVADFFNIFFLFIRASRRRRGGDPFGLLEDSPYYMSVPKLGRCDCELSTINYTLKRRGGKG